MHFFRQFIRAEKTVTANLFAFWKYAQYAELEV